MFTFSSGGGIGLIFEYSKRWEEEESGTEHCYEECEEERPLHRHKVHKQSDSIPLNTVRYLENNNTTTMFSRFSGRYMYIDYQQSSVPYRDHNSKLYDLIVSQEGNTDEPMQITYTVRVMNA